MYSILIIEDDPAYLSMVQVVLQMEGFEVHTASNGLAGIDRLHKKRPNLILCDIMMPEMDGHMVLETLKKESALADIPFIFVSALGDRADFRRGMSAGADDYLSKPFSADELLAAITGRIHRHEMILQQRGKSDFLEEKRILQSRITKREREVLLMVGQGVTSKAIAEQLGVSLKTVEVHRANLMNKLDSANAASLARWAIIAEQLENSSG